MGRRGSRVRQVNTTVDMEKKVKSVPRIILKMIITRCCNYNLNIGTWTEDRHQWNGKFKNKLKLSIRYSV